MGVAPPSLPRLGITFCDTRFSISSRFSLEHEVRRETFGIAADCLFESTGLDGVEFRQMEIEHHFLLSQKEDALFGLEREVGGGHREGEVRKRKSGDKNVPAPYGVMPPVAG